MIFFLSLVLAASLGFSRAGEWYADSDQGSDSNDCKSAKTACKSLAMLCTFGWDAPGFAPGDTIYLSGTFTNFEKAGSLEPDYFWMQLDLSHGAPGQRLRITSLDATNPATIAAPDSHGINIYSWLQPAQGHVQIDNLIIVGNGGFDFKNNQTTSGIFIYHDAPGDISDFVIDNVDVSGFSEAGFFSFRYNESNATGVIRDITITNSVFHHNPGYLGVQRPSGSGIVLAGVVGATVFNSTAYRNGARDAGLCAAAGRSERADRKDPPPPAPHPPPPLQARRTRIMAAGPSASGRTMRTA